MLLAGAEVLPVAGRLLIFHALSAVDVSAIDSCQ